VAGNRKQVQTMLILCRRCVYKARCRGETIFIKEVISGESECCDFCDKCSFIMFGVVFPENDSEEQPYEN
jgi:hypothetical protein